MLKTILLPASITLAGIATISLLVFAQPKPSPQPPPPEPAHVQVAVAEAKNESLRLAVSAQGTVEPKREIDLVAQVTGQVVSVESAFVDGGAFTAQDTLLQIDDRDYRAAVLAAQARVAEAQQRLAEQQGQARQARREWRDLGSDNANELFLRKPQVAAARANLNAARGALEQAQLDLQRTRLRVPFSGRVKQTAVNLGQYVTAGTPVASVYDATVVEIRLPLTEKQASLVELPFKPQQTVTEPTPVTISATVAGRPGQWQGELVRTDAYVDAQSRLYYAVVEVAAPFDSDPPLLPGLFVEAKIPGKRLDKVLALPRPALFERDKLLTLDGENKIRQQQVRVLRRTEARVWVQAPGISDTTLITLEKQALTPAGTTVEPVKTPAVELDNPLALFNEQGSLTAAKE